MSSPGRRVPRPVSPELSESGKHVSTPGFAGMFPTVWNFLSKQRDLGEIHQTGSITIFVDGGKIKLCVNDRPARQSCFVSGDTLMRALEVVEQGLTADSLKWSSAGYRRRSKAQVYKRTSLLDA